MASENHQQRASLTVKSNRKQAVFSFSWLSMIHWLWQLFYFLLIMEFVNGADRCLIETVMWAESDQDETRVKADPLTLIHESRTDDVRGRCVCLGVSLLQHTHTHTHAETREKRGLRTLSHACTHLRTRTQTHIWHANLPRPSSPSGNPGHRRDTQRSEKISGRTVTSQRRRPITSRPEQDFILHIKTKYPTVTWNQTDWFYLYGVILGFT